MQNHHAQDRIDSRRPNTGPVEPALAGADVIPVGTFASGQSPRGAFELAAEAEVGTFASGIAAEEPRETA
jgi:hypothetical protein